MQVIHLGARKLVQKLYKGVVDEDFYGCGKVLPHGQRPAADDELNTYAGHQEGSKLLKVEWKLIILKRDSWKSIYHSQEAAFPLVRGLTAHPAEDEGHGAQA